MKRNVLEFIRRGLMACGLGPIILAVLYLILHHRGALDTLTVEQVSMGIFSISALAFVAGGMNAIYQIERLPLMAAISIHGGILYVSYLITYLLNDWLKWGVLPVLVFSCIFVIGYLVIWVAIYVIIKRNTASLNEKLRQKQHNEEDM